MTNNMRRLDLIRFVRNKIPGLMVLAPGAGRGAGNASLWRLKNKGRQQNYTSCA
jgi:hypothetical protein